MSLRTKAALAVLLSLLITPITFGSEVREIKPIAQSSFTPIRLTPDYDPHPQFREPPTPTKAPIPALTVEPKAESKIKTYKPTVADAKRYAKDKLGSKQYECINNIFKRESGWNPLKYNKAGSGAYGIPQALPGSKMSKFGKDWKTNPITQVKWGINYVNKRYGSACEAWSFWKRNRWY